MRLWRTGAMLQRELRGGWPCLSRSSSTERASVPARLGTCKQAECTLVCDLHGGLAELLMRVSTASACVHVATFALGSDRSRRNAPLAPAMVQIVCSPATHPAWQTGSVFAPRDLVGGGTWIGVAKSGKFGLLTNFREPGVRSRAFLRSGCPHMASACPSRRMASPTTATKRAGAART